MPVTDDDAAHVRRAFEAFNERFEALRGDALTDYHAEFFTSDSVVENADGFPTADTYVGADGYRRWYDDTYTEYDRVAWTLETVEPRGERVVMVGVIRGQARVDGTWLEMRLGCALGVRDRRIDRVDLFLTPEGAQAHAAAVSA